MNDQTFHTPSFGDEEFDLPPMHMQGGHQMSGMHHAQHLQHYQHHQAPQMGMINPAQDGLIEGQPSYQQPVYLQPQEHPMHNSYGSPQQPPGNYLIQQQPGGPRLLVMQPPQQPSQQQQQNQQTQMQQPQQQGVGQQPQYGRSPPQGAGPQDTHNTTSEDSDDSAQHHAPMGPAAVKRPSPEPAGVDPIQGGPMAKQLAKKPKVQKKKKKRDPNEPQKPVSAYALFFRDTQAAIKGQNPNASFGEVSKIVASMWDGLDSEHKSVYKQKTEAAKKDYLKALAAYRASLVSKGGTESEGGVSPGMYNATNGGNAPNMSGYPTPASYYPSQGGSPPDPARSPLLSPPHHMGMGMMGHMGPPHHHHQYMHHSQPPQSNQMQPLQSPHQSPQHHMPPGPMGTQQHMGPQGMGQQQLSPMGPQMGQQMQPQQMPPQNQQMQSQNQQMPPQNQQIPSQNQQMPPQNQQMASQNQQMQPQNQQSQMPPQVQQQMNQQNQHMSPNQNQHMSPSQQMAQQQQQQQQMGQQGGHMGQQMMGPQSVAQQQQLSNSPTHQMMSPQGPPLGMPQQHHSPPHGTQLNQHPMMASHPQQQQTNGNTEQRTSCIRHGCTNPAIANSEWEDEYCSNECVVSHCRDVFTSWVASNNNQSQTYSAVK